MTNINKTAYVVVLKTKHNMQGTHYYESNAQAAHLIAIEAMRQRKNIVEAQIVNLMTDAIERTYVRGF